MDLVWCTHKTLKHAPTISFQDELMVSSAKLEHYYNKTARTNVLMIQVHNMYCILHLKELLHPLKWFAIWHYLNVRVTGSYLINQQFCANDSLISLILRLSVFECPLLWAAPWHSNCFFSHLKQIKIISFLKKNLNWLTSFTISIHFIQLSLEQCP